ncbi:glycosyltransferase family 4 protein [Tsukamurella tyrosinosolvens]|jgi:glycosyltransferase involved in cell wall biosynthesis|nr:group 1 glycosyl transferase [Tsukamurella tyrosinosolvens]KZL94646.1 group 1 glycosyl transferase [Tsukamurella tyrosinosolvens]MCA4997401.1 glycosyltransferase family 4 protein [Tsukamurella tyrosinosolvens]QRY85417.1 glycosyltransferase family 4 protein [Tsukamurella tyrosinosolvens]
MRVVVPLAGGLSPADWAGRHRAGEVPDRSPYGLHQLADHGLDVRFAPSGVHDRSRVMQRVARSVRHRTDGYELVGAPSLADADAVLAYDERTGVPALLRGEAPVAAGIGWLTTRASAGGLHGALAARALPRAAAVWAQCSAVLPVIGSEWRVAPERLHFIPLGIDTSFYTEQPAPASGDVVMSAGEDRFRDHTTLVAAVEQVRGTVPQVTLELASSLPVSAPEGLVTVHTERLNGRIRDLYRRAAVVAIALHPTVTGSGLTVVLEAMASGRPLVVTDNPGVSDYVQHGVTGLLVPPGDTDAMATAIRTLLIDEDMRLEMGRRAAAATRERFTTKVMAHHLAEMIRAM